MRLAALTLHRYGNYEAERICFDPRPGVVNVLMAPNGAGKSVLRTATTDLLFGIGNQTAMGFRFGYPGMRMDAEAIARDGSRISFVRRKTRGNVVTDADDQPMDPAFLHGILDGRDRAHLERLFVLDTEALRSGGQALLATGGDVASALLSAAGGIQQARTLRTRLERQRDDLAPTRKTAARPFYQALETFQDARRRARAATVQPDEYFRQHREVETLDQQRRERNAETDAASAEIARLERVRRVRQALAQHAEAMGWLDAHPDAPVLPADLGPGLTAARLEAVTRAEVAQQAGVALAKAIRDADDLTLDAALLGQADQIERLAGEAGAARKARNDLPGVRGQHQSGLARTGDLLRQLGSSLSPERGIDAVPTRSLRARTQQLIREHTAIDQSLRDAAERIEERARERADLEQRLAQTARPVESEPLEILLDSMRADGNPAQRLAEADQALTRAETDLAAACARVPGWRGDAETLAALRPLTMDLYNAHATTLFAGHTDAAAARRRFEDENARLQQARAAAASVDIGGTVPDETTVDAARRHRDSLWRLIWRRAFADDPPSVEDERAHTAGMPLPLAFERGLRDADALADRRFREADLVARLEAARHALTAAERLTAAAAERARVAEERLSQERRAWTQVCAPLPLGEEPALADIQAFLTAREQVIEARRRHALAAAAAASLHHRHAAWSESLADRLGLTSSDLTALLAHADRTLAQTRKQRQERNDLEARHTRAEQELHDARTTFATLDARRLAWRDRWTAVLSDLGRPPSEEPVETEAVLGAMEELATEHARTAQLTERIAGMDAEIERFTREVRTLAAALPSVAVADDPFEAVPPLRAALNRERGLEQRRRVLGETLDNARIGADAAERALDLARTTLRAHLDLIGADTAEDAERRLALSIERARHEAARDAALAGLREAGDGLSLDVLRVEVEQVPADEIAARIEAAAAARREAGEAAQRIAEEASAQRQRLAGRMDETAVNAAAADQHAAAASLSRTLDEALVYHTASLMLGRALEIVEQSGDSSLLRRLGAIFETLTCGACTRVVTEPNDDGSARLALIQRDFPEERQSIEQLSEGARDQFFLALRVAAIEDHLVDKEPLPFVGDDILQTFDDARALAALRVLAELSRTTQVIVLTHHRHILDLAAGLPEGMVFACRREAAAVTAA